MQQKYLKQKGLEHYLMARPEFAVSGKNLKNRGKRLIGIPTSVPVIEHGLELISTYIAESCEEIYFEDMLVDLLNYSYEDKRKFDIVAAMICAEIGDEDLMMIKPSKKVEISNDS